MQLGLLVLYFYEWHRRTACLWRLYFDELFGDVGLVVDQVAFAFIKVALANTMLFAKYGYG